MRHLLALAIVLGLSGCAANPHGLDSVEAARTPAEGVAIRFIITRDAPVPGGGVDRKTYENSVLMASGNTFNGNFDPMFRIKLTATDQGSNAHVVFELHDSMRAGILVGSTITDVPIGGQSSITLPGSEGFAYAVVLKASRRALPKG